MVTSYQWGPLEQDPSGHRGCTIYPLSAGCCRLNSQASSLCGKGQIKSSGGPDSRWTGVWRPLPKLFVSAFSFKAWVFCAQLPNIWDVSSSLAHFFHCLFLKLMISHPKLPIQQTRQDINILREIKSLKL